ncbi:MAG: pilus assembly protein [Candidatus Krumholzibacteriia bacterium]
MKREKPMTANPTVRAMILASIIAAVAGAPAPAAAQECQVPTFVKQTNLPPNVMLMFDNSESMNEPVFHDDYNPDLKYTGRFNELDMYYVSVAGTYSPKSFSNAWPNTPTAWLVNSVHGQPGRYCGNYLNWIFFHATDAQRLALPRLTRVQVAKSVVANVVLNQTNVRFGLSRFNYNENDPGGQIIAPCGSSLSTILAALDSIVCFTNTPIAETMEDVLDYYKRTDADAPIQAACQYNFLIVMTDGFPTHDLDVSRYLWDADGDGVDPGSCETLGAPTWNALYFACSDHMDDVAYYMRHTDLRPDMGTVGETGLEGQNVITYVIGYGLDIDILGQTAVNGDGLYFLAENATQLWMSMERVMLDIIERISAGAAVAVVSSERSDEDYLFRAKFMPVKWNGYLEKFRMPVTPASDPVWEAGRLLSARDPGDRDIRAAVGGSVIPFEDTRASTLRAAMGVASDAEAAAVIDWTRGTPVSGLRDREGFVLGDIVHAAPVVVGPPRHFLPDPAFQTYLEETRDRTRMVYVAANDGMLHAFNAETGAEAWAFIPTFALPKLAVIADEDYCHTYSCDLSPVVVDALLDTGWRTVLIGGGRQGGHEYFAMDVTDPAAPSLLWQASLPDGVDFASDPLCARVGGEPLVLVGSGLDETYGRGYLHAINLQTGAVAGSALLSERSGEWNKITAPQAADLDFDSDTDVVYCGDLFGTLWRLVPGDDPNPATWGRSALFTNARPITVQPALAYGDDGYLSLCFGTGLYLDDQDVFDLEQHSFYCVRDARNGATLTRADLEDRTAGTATTSTPNGWYVDLWHASGERVTERAVVLAGAVYFTSFCPANIPCTYGGQSWLYRLDLLDGGAPEDEDGVPLAREEDLGEGIASRPVVDLANEQLIVQSSDATITTAEIGVPLNRITVRSWRENFDGATSTDGQTDGSGDDDN